MDNQDLVICKYCGRDYDRLSGREHECDIDELRDLAELYKEQGTPIEYKKTKDRIAELKKRRQSR